MKRDGELVDWLARLGACELRHVQERYGISRSVAYELVARLIEAGLLERLRLLWGEPALLRATRAGIAYSGLALPPAPLSAHSWRHWSACADVALWIEHNWGPQAYISERELVRAEEERQRPLASAQLVSSYDDYGRGLHRPDLVIRTEGGQIAVEVELTAKAPKRLEKIIRGWRRCRFVERTIYVCPAGPAYRAVERAIMLLRAGERVELLDLAEIAPPDRLRAVRIR